LAAVLSPGLHHVHLCDAGLYARELLNEGYGLLLAPRRRRVGQLGRTQLKNWGGITATSLTAVLSARHRTSAALFLLLFGGALALLLLFENDPG